MKRIVRRQYWFILVCFAIVTSALPACDLVAQPDQPDETVAALSAAIAGTATASQNEDSSSGDLATAEAEATARSIEIFATQTAQPAGQDQVQPATATVAAPILAELPFYGLDASSGHVGWVHDPLTLELEGYHVFEYGNDFMNITARDFALAADITWDTQYGSSGCGFMFRSNGNQNKPSQYMVVATRFANGHVLFLALSEGEIANIYEFYPRDDDRSFDAQINTTNRLAVVARGNILEIYTNRVKIGEIDTTQPPGRPVLPDVPMPPIDKSDLAAVRRYQSELKEHEEIVQQTKSDFQSATNNYKNRQAVFDDGFLAMTALSESGHTACKFDQAWLWLLDP